MKVFIVICAWETNTHARMNLYEISTFNLCWSWSVSQFSTCMSLLKHVCQRHSLNSQTDSQMYTFLDQVNWQFVQILMASKFESKLRALETDDIKRKTYLFPVHGKSKSALYCFVVFFSFGFCHLCPVHKNAQPPITAILFTYLLHALIVNVKCRMDFDLKENPISACSLISWNTILPMEHALTSVNMQENVTSLWLLWKSLTFPDLYWNSLTC